MRFNYGYERKKFDENWKKLRKEYAAAGMSQDAIEEMYRFDLDTFNAERAYCKHTQYLPEETIELEEETGHVSPFLKKYGERMQVDAGITDPDRRYGWIDELDDEEIVKNIKSLAGRDIEFLTLHFEGFSQNEIAKRFGLSQQFVSKRFVAIRKKLKKI